MTAGRQANNQGDTPLERAGGSSGGSLNSELFALSPKEFKKELKAMSGESAGLANLELLDAGNPLTIEGSEPPRQKADSPNPRGDQLPQFVQAKQIFEDSAPSPPAVTEEDSAKINQDSQLKTAQNAFLSNWFGFDAKADEKLQEQGDRKET